MTTIKVMGHRDNSLKNVNFGRELEGFTVSDAVQFSTDRASSSQQIIESLKPDDIVELIFEEDIHRWVTVAELERDFKNQLSRGDEPGVLEIPARLPTGDTSRGATSWVLKALRVLKFDPMEKAADTFAEAWDKKLMPKPGLYRYDQGPDALGEKLDKLLLKDDPTILLFIHGTFSSTTNGFSRLSQEVWKVLQQTYGDRIFGYDHKTLSLSPIENALDLVQKLPENARLHLVTHSRGGLIGELLCRGGRTDGMDPFDEHDRKLTLEHGFAVDKLVDLSDLLTSKNIRVERFVRVACPARGTTLVSTRLDRWLEVIVNVIGKLLPPGASTAYGILTDLLLDFKKQAANPDAIPGLAAMVPVSSFIKMINRPDVELDVDLSVVAGDVEKNDLTGRLATFFTDLFYSEEHDLVVQTPAMYGGPARKAGRYFFHKGSSVNHFNYFSNKKTAEIIREALTLSPGALGDKGFRPLAEAYVSAVPELEISARSYQKRSNLSQPVVYLLPGIMGTHLSAKGNRVWLDAVSLAQGKMKSLGIDDTWVEPQALVGLAYAKLVDYLSATHEVIPFPYDWRKSILDEADRFARVLEAKLKETKADQPIRILAHSMGGLVTRAMIGSNTELWKKIQDRDGARFVMLGTPNKGSYKIPRLIFGQDKTFRMLAMLDIINPAEDLLNVIVRYPGILQLLPMEEDGKWNFAEADTWDRFPNPRRRKWVKPRQADLDQVKRFHEALERGRIEDWDSIVYVAGYERGAPVAVGIDDKDKIVFQATDRGDGTVPWESGILPELEKDRTYYMKAAHGDLANHRDSFGAIYDLLNEGVTTRLAKTPPRDRGQEVRYELRDEGVDIYPTQQDLEAAVLGAQPILHLERNIQPVRVSVVHGNLSFCSNPVAVGHYEGDDLYSAEKALDHHLNGRLSDRLQLGLYPGAEGTVEVVLNDKGRKPGGAIVVGLGKAGELSPRRLSSSFANALREFGVKTLENNPMGEDGELTISTLLIGTGGTGLSVRNSVDAILSAVLQANNSFSQIVGANRGGSRHQYNIRIAEVQFIELFKDQAILAVKALEPFRDNHEFTIEPKLQSLQGGWKRIAYEEPAGWWNRIHVRAGENRNDALIFSVPTDRARSEDSRLLVQRPSLDRLIGQAVQNPNWDQTLATAMFELMIPNRIKGSFKDMQSVLFVVDREAARYPWELLFDQQSGNALPLVIQMGMIRQFSTFSFQERVVDVKNKDVMVIGNPANPPGNFSNLPGAEQEAHLVAAKLEENGFEVKRAIHTDPGYIMNHLFSKDYRVLHLAGHGVYEYQYKESEEAEPEVYTGMVLGDGIFLTANEFKQKMHIPELVFINCCHLGKFSSKKEEDKTPRYAFNDFAASLSEQLIDMGVRAVIAAGWAVDDAAALTFAEVFYDHLLKGYRFGDAVKAARVETYRLHKDRTNTWGAYQCYGDPAYRLVINPEGDQGTQHGFVDVEEAIVKINQLYERSKTTSTQGIGFIRSELKKVTDEIERENPAWLRNAKLLDALGEAFGEAFWIEEAVKYYDLAIESGKSTAPIKAIEQSANFHIRLAVQDCENNPETYGDAKGKIEKQIKKIKHLMGTIGETEERLSMVGGGYKRLAQLASSRVPEDCASALQQMEKYYNRAWAKKKKGSYPLSNALTASIVQALRASDPDTGNLSDAKQLIKIAEELANQDKLSAPDDFWAATGVADVKLLTYIYEYLIDNQFVLSENLCNELVREYKSAWQQYGSARELNSIIEHYAFLAVVIKKSDAPENLCNVLEKILNSLKSTYEEVD